MRRRQREKIVCASVLWLHERMAAGKGAIYRGTYLYFIVEYAFLNKLNMYEVALFTLQMKISINKNSLMVK